MASSSPVTVPFSSYTPSVAIVTGGAQGIGYAISHRLADDGFDIAVNDIPAKIDQINAVVAEIRKKGRRAAAAPGDVSTEEGVSSIINKTVEDLGGVDVMVANAGLPPSFKRILEVPLDYFDLVQAVNTRGVFLCFKHAAAQMVKQGRGGRLIAASSVAGKTGDETWAEYCASKFAVRGIAQSAAAEFRKYGITVNTYAPGSIKTHMAKAAASSDLLGDPECVASIVSYIAKPESYFLNGQSITVDGGHYRFD